MNIPLCQDIALLPSPFLSLEKGMKGSTAGEKGGQSKGQRKGGGGLEAMPLKW